MRIYRPGRRLSNFTLSRNLFRIIPVVNSTVVTGIPGARRRPFSLAVFNIVFSTRPRCYLVAFAPLGFWMKEHRAVYDPLGILET